MNIEQNPTFNLIDEPWLPVTMLDGSNETVSLRDTFLRGDLIADVLISAHLERAAVMDFFSAVTYRVFSTKTNGRPVDVWKAAIRGDLNFAQEASQYFDQWKHRFDLFDPERPFLQTAGLTGTDNQMQPISRFATESGSGSDKTFAGQSSWNSYESVSYADAVILLITGYLFDAATNIGQLEGHYYPSKGGKCYPGGMTGRAGLSSQTLIIGTNLLQTILLNSPQPDETNQRDTVHWELSDQEVAMDARTGDAPRGIADFLLYPTRAIRLIEKNKRVIGSFINPSNVFNQTTMISIITGEIGHTADFVRDRIADVPNFVKTGDKLKTENGTNIAPREIFPRRYLPSPAFEESRYAKGTPVVHYRGSPAYEFSPTLSMRDKVNKIKSHEDGHPMESEEVVGGYEVIPSPGERLWSSLPAFLAHEGGILERASKPPRNIEAFRDLFINGEIDPVAKIEIRYTRAIWGSSVQRLALPIHDTLTVGSALLAGTVDEDLPETVSKSINLALKVGRQADTEYKTRLNECLAHSRSGRSKLAEKYDSMKLSERYYSSVNTLIPTIIRNIDETSDATVVWKSVTDGVYSSIQKALDEVISAIPSRLFGIERKTEKGSINLSSTINWIKADIFKTINSNILVSTDSGEKEGNQ